MKELLGYANADHAVTVLEDCDWGGPCEYKPICRCGWTGTKVADVLNIDGSGELGTRYSAFAEALDHIGLTVQQYIDQSEVDIDRWLAQVKQWVDAANDLRSNIQNMRHLA